MRYFYFQHVVHFDRFHLSNLFREHGFEEVKGGRHIRVEGELSMPCVWGIFRKDENRSAAFEPCFDLALQIKAWFDNISLDQDNVLANLASSNAHVYVWGIGIHTQMLLAMSPLADCNIKCFVDKDERLVGKSIGGRRIEPLSALDSASDRDVIVIGAPTHSEKMHEYLVEETGFRGSVVVCGFGDVRSNCLQM